MGVEQYFRLRQQDTNRLAVDGIEIPEDVERALVMRSIHPGLRAELTKTVGWWRLIERPRVTGPGNCREQSKGMAHHWGRPKGRLRRWGFTSFPFRIYQATPASRGRRSARLDPTAVCPTDQERSTETAGRDLGDRNSPAKAAYSEWSTNHSERHEETVLTK